MGAKPAKIRKNEIMSAARILFLRGDLARFLATHLHNEMIRASLVLDHVAKMSGALDLVGLELQSPPCWSCADELRGIGLGLQRLHPRTEGACRAVRDSTVSANQWPDGRWSRHECGRVRDEREEHSGADELLHACNRCDLDLRPSLQLTRAW